jgi:hypothetical protein
MRFGFILVAKTIIPIMKKTTFLIIFLLITISIGIAQPDNPKCNKGYILNINGKNCCIDTIDMYYPLYTPIQNNIMDYRIWHKTILMQIFQEKQWYQKKDYTEDKMRILLFNIRFDSIYLFLFSSINNKNTQLTIKKMPFYAPPLKLPTGIDVKKDNKENFLYYYVHYSVFDIYSRPDTIVYDSTKTGIEQKWHVLNYGKIDTVRYTTVNQIISHKRYLKLIKIVESLKNYNDAPDMWMDDIIIEYVYNNNYQLIRTTRDGSTSSYNNACFRKNIYKFIDIIHGLL